MRLSRLFGLLALASPLLATPVDPAAAENKAATTTAGGDTPDAKGTEFNGIEVPPMTELSGETLDADIKNGYWYSNKARRSLAFPC
jgi:hypothetical protein